MLRENSAWYGVRRQRYQPPEQGCRLVSLLAYTSMDSFIHCMHCIVHCIAPWYALITLLAQLLA